jgi:hypothetical protein
VEGVDTDTADGVDNEEPGGLFSVLGREGVDVADETGRSDFGRGGDDVFDPLILVLQTFSQRNGQLVYAEGVASERYGE